MPREKTPIHANLDDASIPSYNIPSRYEERGRRMERRLLARDQLISVIDGRSNAPRVPMLIHFWVLFPDRYGDRKGALLEILSRYPMDAQMIYVNMPGGFEGPEDDPQYRWFPFDDPYKDGDVAIDESAALTDWEQLDGVLSHPPDPYYKGMSKHNAPPDGRYRLGYWWNWLFERHYGWRGMTSALLEIRPKSGLRPVERV